MNNRETERKRQSSDWVCLFNSATSISSMGVHVVDLETREMYFSNEAGFRLINMEPCDYQGKKCYEVFFGTDHPCDNCRLEHTKHGVTKHEAYVESVDKTFLTNTEITTWNDREVFVEYITDITLMKQEQQELKTSKTLYQKRLDTIMRSYPNALGSLVMNLTQDYVTSQKRLYPFIREQSDKHISEYLDELKMQMPIEDFQKYSYIFSKDHLLQIFQNGEQSVVLTHRHWFMDKSRWITTTGNFIVNPVTKDIEVYVIATDVTDKILSEQVVMELINQRYDILALIYPKEGRVDFRYSGNEFEDIPEISIEEYEHNRRQSAELFGENGSKQYIEYTDMNTIINNLNASGKYFFTMTIEVKGRKRYKRYVYNYLSGNHEIILSTVQDVTQIYEKEKNQMDAIQDAIASAERANAAKTDFLSTMSHDMRTPMNGILGLVTLMDDMELPEEVKENLRQIQISGRYLLNLLNDTLDVNKIEANKIELHPVVTEAFKLTDNINTNAHILAVDKGVSLTMEKVNPEAITPTILYVDESRLEQIFMNLISNAVKFTPRGGSVRLRIERLETTDDYIMNRYEIIDTGIGMGEEFLSHLFEPFAQEGRTATERESGTGLGMTIVKRLVELMGGSIEVKSKLNQGTTFTLIFRFDRYKGSYVETMETDISGINLEGKKILLCEDHPLNRQIAVKMLEKKGMAVETVDNGADGVKHFSRSEMGYYDLILMDVRMPVMDGLEATREIRKLQRPDAETIPIIAMTANAFDNDVENCLNAGMNAHIAKPIDVEKMYYIIAEHVSGLDTSD